jgi:hypothetical protein
MAPDRFMALQNTLSINFLLPDSLYASILNCFYRCCFHRSYLNKLPARFEEDDKILITDPMLATGGTMLQVSSFVRVFVCSGWGVRVCR